MKTQIVPYGCNDESWATAYDFYNHSNDEHTIAIKIQNYDGTESRDISRTLEPRGHAQLAPADIRQLVPGKHTIIVEGPDELLVTPLMTFRNDSGIAGFGALPVHNENILKN